MWINRPKNKLDKSDLNIVVFFFIECEALQKDIKSLPRIGLVGNCELFKDKV